MRLIINNRQFSKEEILQVDVGSIQEKHVKAIFTFLREWWNDEAFINAKTSGSTGVPKIIRLNKQSMSVSAQATGDFFDFPIKICSPLSANFIAGKMMLVRAMEWDAEIHCIKPSENPLELVKQEYDFMVMTPHQLSKGIETKLVNRMALLKNVLLGGSPVDEKLETELQSINSNIFLGYGMTETMSHVAIRALNGEEHSTKYKAVKGIHFSQDEDSCLVIRAEKLLESPLKTNDVVELLDEYSFVWKSRLDHVINSGGIKIFPHDVEQQIKNLIPFNFYVAGKKHDQLGQQVTLYIESDKLEESYKMELLHNMKMRLPRYSNPKEIVEIKEFEYTSTGKLKRNIY